MPDGVWKELVTWQWAKNQTKYRKTLLPFTIHKEIFEKWVSAALDFSSCCFAWTTTHEMRSAQNVNTAKKIYPKNFRNSIRRITFFLFEHTRQHTRIKRNFNQNRVHRETKRIALLLVFCFLCVYESFVALWMPLNRHLDEDRLDLAFLKR